MFRLFLEASYGVLAEFYIADNFYFQNHLGLLWCFEICHENWYQGFQDEGAKGREACDDEAPEIMLREAIGWLIFPRFRDTHSTR
ncbi:hypothetical protein C5167_010294 [Papaver somniferum]|uniref:Uncharacterized protein n=1 Tax=Papaver somniferum TaxID=3469 RepID=A0A4Y7K0Z4_PAPSO|nr:hypothetical protein C5167_010294 [Papaver somniferum]